MDFTQEPEGPSMLRAGREAQSTLSAAPACQMGLDEVQSTQPAIGQSSTPLQLLVCWHHQDL